MNLCCNIKFYDYMLWWLSLHHAQNIGECVQLSVAPHTFTRFKVWSVYIGSVHIRHMDSRTFRMYFYRHLIAMLTHRMWPMPQTVHISDVGCVVSRVGTSAVANYRVELIHIFFLSSSWCLPCSTARPSLPRLVFLTVWSHVQLVRELELARVLVWGKMKKIKCFLSVQYISKVHTCT